MSIIGNSKRWVAVGAVTLAMCAVSAAQAKNDLKHRVGHGGGDYYCNNDNCRPVQGPVQVPDGGSSAGYLLTAGVLCLGALFVHSRFRKSLMT
jgi:hypothetical protein